LVAFRDRRLGGQLVPQDADRGDGPNRCGGLAGADRDRAAGEVDLAPAERVML
jgi:hypothetical protein